MICKGGKPENQASHLCFEEALYYTPLEYISQYFLLFPQHNFEVRHAADHIVRLISTPGHR